MPSPVQLNDVLVFSIDDKVEKTIKWSQSFTDRSEQYYAIAAKNTSRDNADVNLFVQKNIFNRACNPNDHDHTWSVTSNFQYGQKNEEGEYRFVVLHDKDRKPYQHRFVETSLVLNVGGAAKRLAQNFGYRDDEYSKVGYAEGFLRNYTGHYLHDF